MFKFYTAILALLFMHAPWASERFYELNIDTKLVNFSGKTVEAMVVNQSIPGPKLEFSVGDTAVIQVNNKLNSDASIHWHGLLLPADQDGVPYISNFPIKPGESFTYKFPITHAGTYWYHSHSNIDEQRGQYGSIVIHPAKQQTPDYGYDYNYDEVIQLSDWIDENPKQVLANLKKSGDWYAYKKDSVVSIKDYIDKGRFKTWLKNRWQRMEGMDVSDVAYDALLANGKKNLQLLPEAKAGDKVRLRFINSAASSYFFLEQTDASFTVIAADGTDVQAVEVERFLIGMAETYDVIVTIPKSGSLAINANNIDGSGHAAITLGSGQAQPAPPPQKPDLYQDMNHSSHAGNNTMSSSTEMDHSAHKHHHMQAENQPETELSYKLLKARVPVKYQGQLREVKLDLTGDMESYNWSFNNQILSDADKIKIHRGEVVRMVFNNTTMMRHPIHLHGHFFKVISGNGDYDVIKHTVDVGPMAEVIIEFAANESKDWFFHCHNLYHAKTGMARVVRYSDYSGNPALEKAMQASDDMKDTDWYQRTDIGLYTDYATASVRYSNVRYALELEAERSGWQESEVELLALKNYGRWSQLYVGANYHNEAQQEHKWEYMLGLRYRAPFNLELDTWLNDQAELQLGFETAFQLSKHWQLEFSADSEGKKSAYLQWRSSPRFALSIGKTDDTDLSLGIAVTL